MREKNPKRLLSPKDVAEELEISTSAVTKLIVGGSLPSTTISAGGRQKLYVKRESLDRWIKAREREALG